jgi:hypothetical protein
LAHLDLSGNAGMDCGGEAGAGLAHLRGLTALLLAGAAPGGPPPAALAALQFLSVLDLGADPDAAFAGPALGDAVAADDDGRGGEARDLAAGVGGGGDAPAAVAGEFVPPLPPGGLPALTSLDLSGRPLGPAGLAALAAGLAGSPHLARLSLAGCGPGVGPVLPPALARHAPCLVSLDVSHCGLTHLPDWLGGATSLTALDARANPGLVLRRGGGEGGEAASPPLPDDVAALAAVAARGAAAATTTPQSPRPPPGRLALAKAGDAGWDAGSWAALLALAAAAPGLPPSALVATARGRAAVAAARGG